MPTQRTKLGQHGEKTARKWLEQRGLVFVEKNFRTRYGELDLIMRDGKVLVFVEVKTRRSRTFGQVEEAIDDRKLERLRMAGDAYLVKHHDQSEVRLDLIIIESVQGRWEVRHLSGIG